MHNLAFVLHSPVLYTAAIVTALAMLLVLSIRNEGWLPVFRQLRIRRALLIALLAWGLAVLSNPAPAQPVAHRRDQSASARVSSAKTPTAGALGHSCRRRTCTAAASVAPQAAPSSALHTPPLGVGRTPTASRALLSHHEPHPMQTTADLFEGVFDNRATNQREIWQGGHLCRFVRRACVGHTGSVWKEVHAPWGTYPDLPSNAATVPAA